MTSINTIFKRVYGEALAPYGFVKIKGRQPYFVRMIGDEILQVITYMNEWCSKQFYKAFDIYCGVATVYRQRLNLERSPLENSNWFKTNSGLYVKSNPYDYDSEYLKEISENLYKSDDEESMICAVKHSFEATEKIMLPILNDIKDLDSCMEHFYKFNLNRMILGSDNDFGNGFPTGFYNEGLLHLKTYTLDNFKERKEIDYNKGVAEVKRDIEIGKIKFTQKDFEKRNILQQEAIQKQVNNFDMLINDPEENKKAMEELERRKNANMDALRGYGFYL